MKNITKYIRINGAFLALTDDNKLVGFVREVKPIARKVEDSIERQLEGY